MSIFEDLFYGNIVPAEKSIKLGSEHAKLNKLMSKNEEKLLTLLSKEKSTIFEKYKDCVFEMMSISEQEYFTEGVKFGIKIATETFIGTSNNFMDI